MKKLLSLLSVLTISGTAVPTTIAASLYQKEEIKLENSDINYSQTNNLKSLNREKRQNNEQNIFGILQSVSSTNWSVLCSGIVLNNKIYFGSVDGKVYEYDPATNQQNKVCYTNSNIYGFGVVLNNKIYFNSGNFSNTIYEYEPLELIKSAIINVKDQVKKGIYLHYKKENPNNEIKHILNINLENLTLSNVIVDEKQKNKSSNLEKNTNICQEINQIFENNTSVQQTQNTVSCSKELKEIKTFQKMNGFSKSETTSNDENWSSDIENQVTITSSSESGIPTIFGTNIKVEVQSSHKYSWGESKTYTLENNSTSSDTETKTTEYLEKIVFPSQSVVVPPKSKVSINILCWQNNIEIILNYHQKVTGVVSANFIDKNNNNSTISISIKDAMISLRENNILPLKININNDDSINFSYDIKSSVQKIMGKTEINQIDNFNLNKKM